MQELAVSEYIGIPFVDLGRDREGLDCWGLFRLVLQEQLGIELPSFIEVYEGETSNWEHLGRAITGRIAQVGWEPVPAGQEQPGDGVLCRLRGEPMHVGVVVRPGIMIHTHRGTNACLEPYRRAQWRSRILGFYRHRSMT